MFSIVWRQKWQQHYYYNFNDQNFFGTVLLNFSLIMFYFYNINSTCFFLSFLTDSQIITNSHLPPPSRQLLLTSGDFFFFFGSPQIYWVLIIQLNYLFHCTMTSLSKYTAILNPKTHQGVFDISAISGQALLTQKPLISTSNKIKDFLSLSFISFWIPCLLFPSSLVAYR